jgi:hypothetical protein
MQTFAPHHKGRVSGAHHVWTYGSACFKVFTIVTDSIDIDNRKLSLYTFSSTEPRWSKPRRCFHKRGFTLLCQDAAVSHGVAHWFVSYHNEKDYVVKRYTYNVNAETGHQSLTDLSIPADQFKMRCAPAAAYSRTKKGQCGTCARAAKVRDDLVRRFVPLFPPQANHCDCVC